MFRRLLCIHVQQADGQACHCKLGTSVQAAMHVWHGGTWAARGSSELVVRLHEHNAAVMRPLLHMPQLAWCSEQSSQVIL